MRRLPAAARRAGASPFPLAMVEMGAGARNRCAHTRTGASHIEVKGEGFIDIDSAPIHARVLSALGRARPVSPILAQADGMDIGIVLVSLSTMGAMSGYLSAIQ